MTPLQKAEHLVRNHPTNKELMELGFGCEVIVNEIDDVVGVIKGDWFSIDEQKQYYEITDFQISWEENDIEILGKPAHLEHYLRVLNESAKLDTCMTDDGMVYLNNRGEIGGYLFEFNLTTGKPATEKDAELFLNLTAVSEVRKVRELQDRGEIKRY